MQPRWTALFVVTFALGCEHHEKDSHTEVFKTVEQGSADRRAKQVEAHKELAVSVLRFARPDVAAKADAGTSVVLTADGIHRAVDLSPIEPEMAHHANEERAILRKYLEAELRPFDVDRLKALGFERVRKQAAFVLVNAKGLAEIHKSTGTSLPLSREVVSNVYRASVIRRPGPPDAPPVVIPITVEIATAWGVKPEAVDAAATQNLRDALKQPGANWMDTVPVGPVGRTGNLRSSTDPAVVLLPEFLDTVRQAWKTEDNLVLFAPSATGMVFAEEHNQKLLDLLTPQWKKQLLATTDPLSGELLLLTPGKVTFATFTPTTKPSTAPATKPAPYLAH